MRAFYLSALLLAATVSSAAAQTPAATPPVAANPQDIAKLKAEIRRVEKDILREVEEAIRKLSGQSDVATQNLRIERVLSDKPLTRRQEDLVEEHKALTKQLVALQGPSAKK